MCPIYKLFSWSPLEQYFDATWCNIDEIWCNMTEHDAICCNVLYHIILLHDILNPGPIHHGSDQVGGRPRGGSWPLFFFWNRHFRPARCGRRPSANVRSTLACLALTSPQPFVQPVPWGVSTGATTPRINGSERQQSTLSARITAIQCRVCVWGAPQADGSWWPVISQALSGGQRRGRAIQYLSGQWPLYLARC